MNWDQLGTPQALAAVTECDSHQHLDCAGVGTRGPHERRETTEGRVDDGPRRGSEWRQLDGRRSDRRRHQFPAWEWGDGHQHHGECDDHEGATGNAVMAVHTLPSSSFTSVNNTQTFLDNSPANVSGAGNRAAGAATVAMTGTATGTAPWASAGCDIKAAAGTVTFVPHNNYQAPILTQ